MRGKDEQKEQEKNFQLMKVPQYNLDKINRIK